MARLPRLSIGGLPHLLVQRGHNGQPVFADGQDRALYRRLLDESARAERVQLHGFALLDAEVRIVATPPDALAIGRMMQTLGRRYGGAFNRRHARTGGLWDGRFRATVVEPGAALLQALVYVEDEPGLPDEAETSSRGHHVGQCRDAGLTDPPAYWSLGNTPFDREAAYRALLGQSLTARERERVHGAVMKGWPLGSEAFTTHLAGKTERRLAPLQRGRPPKTPTALAPQK